MLGWISKRLIMEQPDCAVGNWSWRPWWPAGSGCNQRQTGNSYPPHQFCLILLRGWGWILPSPLRPAPPLPQARLCSQGQQAYGICCPRLRLLLRKPLAPAPPPLLPVLMSSLLAPSSLSPAWAPGLACLNADAPLPLTPHHARLLQQENEELRRRLASATRRTEALERELEIGQDCLELELGQSREELDKFKDKFRRCGNEGPGVSARIPPPIGD